MVGRLRFDAAGQCFSVEQIAERQAFATTEVPADAGVQRSGSYVSLVVPDGVASVELRYEDGEAVRQQVTNNTVIVHRPSPAPEAMPDSVVWFDAGGNACSATCE
jgi:hypothetical protein